MSQDIFDYSATVAEINETITALNSRIMVLTVRRLEIAGMRDHEKKVIARSDIISAVTALNSEVADLNDAIKKIRHMSDLTPAEKSRLYAIYSQTQHSKKQDFLAKLPFCYDTLLSGGIASPELPRHYRWIAPCSML
jgi:hypothetical protein